MFGENLTGNFVGLVLDDGFDRAIIRDPVFTGPDVDDLHFGPPIVPGAGTLVLFGVAIVGGGRRRRRDG